MPRIPNNLRERAIGMLDAGMSTEYVTFRTTGSTNDLPRRGRLCVTTHGQDRYIMNTHLRNLFQTATATAVNTPSLHNNRISAQIVRNRLRENGLHARRPYVGCVIVKIVLIGYVHTLVGYGDPGFSLQRGGARVP